MGVVFMMGSLTPATVINDQSQAHLSALCARLLAILTLDRFADYGLSQFVAPVRETAAQVLALCCRLLAQPLLHLVFQHLHVMATPHTAAVATMPTASTARENAAVAAPSTDLHAQLSDLRYATNAAVKYLSKALCVAFVS